MKKVLVPTDFSANSKSGIRFAIQWASQQKLEIVFIHVLHVLKPTQWRDSYYSKYVSDQKTFWHAKFEKFIDGMYKSMASRPGRHTLVIIDGFSADIAILDYCNKNKDVDFICISTRGAGKFKKILGTNTGNLITKSPVAVLAVPKNYKVKPIKNILYLTDFRQYAEEVHQVADFASPLKAPVEALHFKWPDEFSFDENTIETVFKKRFKYGLKVHIEKNGPSYSLIENMQSQIRLRKPSVVILFTDRKRTFFQKVFLPSKSEELSFEIKVPLLVFIKH